MVPVVQAPGTAAPRVASMLAETFLGLVNGLDAAAASIADTLIPATRTMVNISLDIRVLLLLLDRQVPG
jgi:hypothetical protein